MEQSVYALAARLSLHRRPWGSSIADQLVGAMTTMQTPMVLPTGYGAHPSEPVIVFETL